MVALTQSRRLEFGGIDPESAREEIKRTLTADPKATRRVYAAFARKVWTMLIERRLDDELRDWHSLADAVGNFIRPEDEGGAERMAALGDLLRESISLAESSPAIAVARRPHARRLLALLEKETSYVPRRQLLARLGIKTAHLSNILAQLGAHNLVERREDGKQASFRLTARGREILGAATDAPHSPEALLERVREVEKSLGPRFLGHAYDGQIKKSIFSNIYWVGHASLHAAPQDEHHLDLLDACRVSFDRTNRTLVHHRSVRAATSLDILVGAGDPY